MTKKLYTVMALVLFLLSQAGTSGREAFATLEEGSVTAGSIGLSVSHTNLATRDIIYDPFSNKIYASTPSSAGSLGNSIVPISVPSLALGTPIFVGSEPNKLAISDDGKYLYAGLDGSAAVRRVDLPSKTAEIQFSLGSGFCGQSLAEDMVVLKGQPNSVAISKRNSGCSPRHEGVAIYDDGVQRPTMTPGHTGSNVIEPSEDESVLYGYNNETTEFGFRVMSVITDGVVVTSTTQGLIDGFYVDINFEGGWVYATNGALVDPEKLSRVGTYDASGPVLPDPAENRVYFLSEGDYGTIQLKAFDQDTFLPLGTVDIPGATGTPGSLIKVGQNLLAFRTSEEQVFLLKVSVLDKSIFLPFIQKPREGITGHVTDNGIPAANVYLQLRFYNGSEWSMRASTYTDNNGGFGFTNIPSLGPNQKYYVLYLNDAGSFGRLYEWGTRLLESYTAGGSVEIGNFDIADIPLVNPYFDATVSLPYTFSWTPRPATPSDSYEFDLFDPNDFDPYFYTDPPLGYTGSYSLNGLPPGFQQGVPYVWEMWVYSPDGGYGVSYGYRYVTFSSSGIQDRELPDVLSPKLGRSPEELPRREGR